ncbi:ribosome small subunit-dependent GTPase A [Caldimonas thermodepolymerans]|jgi:ribosome small subunit-dependent GTPase A|uniref:Small ribosomal subunit biogenesis GTPase RsgA n=1 Tax=Caldimonas thermodepolymerans TaxID=215580 RepID=A0A2S5T343_9BURK|nr:ribosome small subunit-dependent GTPase A [Caldimonas thermodepolymerans]PPE69392.1 ribosome small subunit-dependent GTPase A [Caldimonas thermodepolymerans]QPC32741.1 ribosome small subunit-dependent GTPase A [Caldimonas thermodepolymerans]RDI03504.1 ribosome biogenesis GTPase [Caldimonas thermodepolymerans]TCP06637.1 ribosome biogenesis GTPase [Caldimonas thermodepolymerans]UZG45551.1 ribosome small subunit-dependent GTPase A [Caldimonas thermodepolymerans]
MTRAVELERGLVVAGYGRHYLVETPEGRRVVCRPRGKKSECVVGDRVQWMRTVASGTDEGVIERIEPRRNLLFRQDEWRTKSFAANLDLLLVMVAVEPQFSESQLSRSLIAAESAGIPVCILLNKVDLPQAAAARERLAPYRAMGYDVQEVSLQAAPDEARAALAPRLDGRATLVLGPSGTGKSTLINLMVPAAQAQVGEISQALNSGRHTTTSTQWYWVDAARTTGLIDSPGFQEFGLRQIDPQQLPAYMPDLRAHVGECRFYNCTHRQEPGCGVRAAVERGEVSASRYRIYGEIHEELSRPAY